MKLDIIKSFKDKRVLLVGDTILDIYIYGNVVGQALDAPVPEVEEGKVNTFFGGNGLVASHILELGGHLTFITVLGADEDAKYYDSLVHPKLKKIFLVDNTRRTTVKRRWYDGWKKLLQVNKVDNHDISVSLEKKLLGHIEREVKNVDVKLGSRGAIAIFNGQYIKSQPYKVRAVDVCGAGDAFLAAFSLGDRS